MTYDEIKEAEKAIEALDERHATSFPDLFYDFLDLNEEQKGGTK